jgi:HSP20 family protein
MLSVRKKSYKPTYRSIFDGFFDYGTNAIQPITGIDSALDGFFSDLDRNFIDYTRPTSSILNRFGSMDCIPRANISKNELGYVIRLAAPGLSRNDFDISVEDNVLTVKSKVEAELDNDGYKEFDYMNFQRSWTLPKNAMVDRIEANYEAGILVMEVPFEDVTKEKTRKIEVK